MLENIINATFNPVFMNGSPRCSMSGCPQFMGDNSTVSDCKCLLTDSSIQATDGLCMPAIELINALGFAMPKTLSELPAPEKRLLEEYYGF